MNRHLPILMITTLLAFGAAPKLLYAQSPADEFAREQTARAEAERLKALKNMTPGAGAADVSKPQIAEPAAGASCFDVTRVDVEGASKISMSAIERITGPYRNKCIGVAEIN